MECRELGEALSAYMDGEAGSPEAGIVEAHLAGCASCRVLLGRMREAEDSLARIEAQVPDEFRETLLARLEKEELLPRRRSLFVFSVRWLAVPAAAAAALALFLLTSRESGVNLGKGPEPPARVAQGPPSAAAHGAGAPAAKEASPVRNGSAVAVTAPEGSVAAAAGELSGEEREIVAWLELLENPVVLEEGGDVDEMEIFSAPKKDRG